MFYIVLGSTAFLFLFLFDIFTLREEQFKKKVFGLIGVGLLIYSAIMLTIVSPKISFPLSIKLSAGLGWFISLCLLIYSLFLELPFVKTYGKKEHNNKLVDTGTYALCRHPGVLWFGFMFFFFFLLTGAKLIFVAGLIWTGLDVMHVYIQEKLFFPKMFPEYSLYIKQTPMLIPTIYSIKKCISTI